jgi:hypothetical protein
MALIVSGRSALHVSIGLRIGDRVIDADITTWLDVNRTRVDCTRVYRARLYRARIDDTRIDRLRGAT